MTKTLPFLCLLAISHPPTERMSVFPGWPIQLDAKSARAADPSVIAVEQTADGVQLIGLKQGQTRVEAGGRTLDISVESTGWALVPVMVAARDAVEETTFTMDHLTQRLIPKTMLSASAVTPPNAKYVLGQKSHFPVKAGDVLLWSMFETK